MAASINSKATTRHGNITARSANHDARIKHNQAILNSEHQAAATPAS